MKTSQWRRAVKNRCVFSARLNALSDRPGDRSAAGTTARQCFMWGEVSHGGLLCVTGEVFFVGQGVKFALGHGARFAVVQGRHRGPRMYDLLLVVNRGRSCNEW